MSTQLIGRYNSVRNFTIEICSPLTIEDYIPQPVPFASPPKWHLAHTTWFFEEMILKNFDPDYMEFHSDFGFLFNSYYNSLGERLFRANRGNITRPSVDEVKSYRAYVDSAMITLLEQNKSYELEELVVLGLNHEQQHQELLITDLKHTLGNNPIFPVYKENGSLVDAINTESGWVTIPVGIYEIGHEGNDFSFDNEHGRHKVFLDDFEISKGLITNKEYLEFMNDEAYSKPELWLDDGWSWIQENKINSPLYWYKKDETWFHFTLSGLKEVNPAAIVSHVSFYEAHAFAAWKGCRLPTEFEWEVASDQFKWGQRWEWTNSAYLPYPKFKIASGAVGEYNGKFMINQMVLRGASVATSPEHSRKTYRNFFQPHYQWQFSGIRLAK